MVIRAIVGGGAAGRCRRSSSLSFVLALSLLVGATATAQEAGGEVPPGDTPPAPVVEAQAPAAAAQQLGRVVADKVSLRCWPSTAAVPPVFEDVLVKDQVVALGRSENGFRQVLPPLGPIGYVSRKFAEADADGRVKTKGTKVAFRYRPRSSEAPVTLLEDATELHVIEEQADWYRCRVPTIEAWVAENEVQVGDAADAALIAGYAAWQQQQQAEIATRLEGIAAAKRLAAQNELDLQQVRVIEQAFAQELTKTVTEQSFDPLDQALDKLTATLSPESAAQSAVQGLRKRIETQRWIAEATAVRDSKPATVPPPPPEPKDELARFQSIGWLRYERRLGGPGIYYLEKGGRRQCLVSCNTGRYDLSLFVDREIGLSGPRRHPATETLSVLDAERLEVLGSPR
ncbi:MAG: hypothetical protein JNM25_10030 [Planctomycetes bacterium]|nr:hypothetical protein [Planctomycetota bacterium]